MHVEITPRNREEPLLLADLDVPDPEIDAIWRDEAQKRWQAYQLGELKTLNYEVVMRKYSNNSLPTGKSVKIKLQYLHYGYAKTGIAYMQ